MRYIVVLLAAMSALAAFGQESKSSLPDLSSNWSKLGPTVEGPRGFTLEGKGMRLNQSSQYELWIKILPANLPAFNKRYSLPGGTEFVLQYVTVDCEKRSLYFEKTAAYGAGNQLLEGKVASLTPSSKKDAVKPGSVGEAVYRFICVETTTLPMTKT